MDGRDGPMPLSELPDYIRSVRESGQGDYVPVVDVGRIVDDRPRRGWMVVAGLATAASVLVAFSGIFAISSTKDISIVAGVDQQAVSEIVSEEGGRIFSVKRNDDGTYRVRVFSFGGIKPLVERLKAKEEFDNVELRD